MDSNYSYTSAGFSPFLTRSIDDSNAGNLDLLASSVQTRTQDINYDQIQQSGGWGSSVRIGNILLDGVKGRISIFDDTNNEGVRLGDLDD